MDALAFTISNNGKCQFNQIYLLNLEKVLSFYEVEGNLSSRQNEKWEKIETKRNKIG